MTASSSSDLTQLVREYVEDTEWQQKKAHVQNTSQAVRTLVAALVDTGSIDEAAMRTVYNLCQNDAALKPETKKQRIAALEIDSEAKATITDRIDEGVGIVGKGTYSVPIEGYEQEAFDLLATAIQTDDRTEIDAAVESFAALDIDGIQAGIISPILYFLHPTTYPISNHRSRTGMERHFGYDMSARLTRYVDDAEKFREVRSNYPFKDDFRHLDSFFNWVSKQDLSGFDDGKDSPDHKNSDDLEATPDSVETTNEYWQQIHRRQEAAAAFLADPSRETLEDLLNALPWFVSRHTDSKLDRIFDEMSPAAVADTLRDAADTGRIEAVLDIPGFGMAASTETLAAIDPATFAPLHKRAAAALDVFLTDPPNPNTTSPSEYETFLDDIETISEQYDLRSYAVDTPPWATDLQVVTRVFRRHNNGEIDLSEAVSPAHSQSTGDEALTDAQSERIEDVSFYWVNQKRDVEFEGEYLRSHDRKWQRDLTVLEPGDTVFHYTDQALRACSVVTSEAYRTDMDGDEYYRVDVTTTRLTDPLPLADIRDALQDPARRHDQDKYPIDKNGNVIQAYLCHLTDDAGAYLLTEADIDLPALNEQTNYFWATANPAIWSVDEIDDGGTVRYTAHNEQGNKKRLFEAFTAASPGDRVLFYESTPVKEIVAEGTVIDGLEPQPTEDAAASVDSRPVNDSDAQPGIRIKFDRRVDGISWDTLSSIPDLEDATPLINDARGSFFPLTEAEFETILALEDPLREGVSQDAIDRLATKLTAPDINITVPEDLYFDDPDRLQREIEASLRSGKHIILTGPPGTGKTKLANAICESATTTEQVDDYRFTTATSEWTAFDTIGGYVPSTSDGGQELLFEPRLFLKCFRQDRIVNEWLIIDEINRSDIDKAFGQLFSVLSGDSTELPYERDRTVELRSLSESTTDEELADIIENPDAFPITPSWRLIATMNTYDKTSLYEMSYAFMRRFNFVHLGVPPLTSDDGVRTSLLDPDGDDNYATAWLADNPELRPVLEDVYSVVAVLWQRVNDYRVIGPSIVYDIIQYLAAYNDTNGTRIDALTSAVISLIYPQLEGMRPEQQKRLIKSLTAAGVPTEHGPVDLALDGALLERKAADFFGITFDDDA